MGNAVSRMRSLNRGQGLTVGDIIRTSYGTGPYRIVAIAKYGTDGPVTLTLKRTSDERHHRGTYWINGVWQREDGRWFRGQSGDEIFRLCESSEALQERLQI